MKLKVKATQTRYAYDFVSVVRLHLGLELLVEPADYKGEWEGERERTQREKNLERLDHGGEVPSANKDMAVGFWTPSFSLFFWFDYTGVAAGA